MNPNKTIAMDVDGVVADLLTNWLAWYNDDYKDNLKPDDITEWDTHKFVKPECGHKIYEYLKDPLLYDNVKPYPDALEVITKLKKAGYRIIYATSSPIESFGIKFFWLKQHNFISDIKDYVELNDKSLVRADMLVDDRPKNLDTFEGKKVLMGRSWNKAERYNINYLYARSWGDVLIYCYEGLWNLSAKELFK